MVYQWINNTLSEWLPQACVLCGHGSQHRALCPDCIRDLPRFTATACSQCGLPLDISVRPALCGHCQQHAPAYDHVISRFAYAQPISQLVTNLKFRGHLHLARLFGELLAESIGSNDTKIQALLPVPLHPGRLRQRGFNQALEIARPLARSLDLPVITDAVSRIRNTQPQSTQTATQRASNIRGAFHLSKTPAYSHIAIVDDVMTSGHTVDEIAKLLRAAGVEQIEVWCVTRAWPHPR
jgi:ComF family protein